MSTVRDKVSGPSGDRRWRQTSAPFQGSRRVRNYFAGRGSRRSVSAVEAGRLEPAATASGDETITTGPDARGSSPRRRGDHLCGCRDVDARGRVAIRAALRRRCGSDGPAGEYRTPTTGQSNDGRGGRSSGSPCSAVRKRSRRCRARSAGRPACRDARRLAAPRPSPTPPPAAADQPAHQRARMRAISSRPPCCSACGRRRRRPGHARRRHRGELPVRQDVRRNIARACRRRATPRTAPRRRS